MYDGRDSVHHQPGPSGHCNAGPSQNAVILVGYSDTNVVYEDLNDSTRHSVKYEEMDQMTSGSGNTYIDNREYRMNNKRACEKLCFSHATF